MSPPRPRPRVRVVPGRVADLPVAARACGEQVLRVVAHRLALDVVRHRGAAGAAGELELAAVPVPLEDGASGAAPGAGGAALPAPAHDMVSHWLWSRGGGWPQPS